MRSNYGATLQKIKSEYLRTIAVALVFIFAILPLFSLSMNITAADLKFIAGDKSFFEALKNTVAYTFMATMITVFVATLAAALLNASSLKYKKLYIVLLTLGMLVPTISIGLGIRILTGINGFLDILFGISTDFRGMPGLVFGSVIAAFPATFLIIYDALLYEDKGPYDAAYIMGISRTSTFFRLTLPYLKVTLLSAFLACFTLIFADYGVPMELAGKLKTLPMYLYDQFMSSFQYGRGAFVGYVLLVPALVSFIFNLLFKDNSVNELHTQLIETGRKVNFVALAFVLFVSFVLFLPQIAFIALSFTEAFPNNLSFTINHVASVFSNTHGVGLLQYVQNSIVIALVTAFLGMCFAYLLAYYTVRKQGALAKLVNLLSLSTIAIPGLVLGIGYIFLFKYSNGLFYGTVFILVVVNIFHFLGTPYIMAKNCLSKINSDYEIIGDILGISRWKIIANVLIPNSFLTLAEMFSYFFLNSMITISAVAFLCTYANQPLSILITSFEKNSNYEMQSVISLLILGINVLYRVVFSLIEAIVARNQQVVKESDTELSREQFTMLRDLEQKGEKGLDKAALTARASVSASDVQITLEQLQSLNYVDVNMQGSVHINEHGLKALAPYKVRKAIILAAGFGERLAPVTVNIPKPLVTINGMRIIDTLLDALIAKDITNIVVVCGYKKEAFNVLKEKYPNIQLVHNLEFLNANNISSLVQVVDRIDRCYICEADLFIHNQDVIQKYEYRTNYKGIRVSETDDWCFENDHGFVGTYKVGGTNCYLAAGISYWNSLDSEKLRKDLVQVYKSRGGKEHLWEKVPLSICKNNYRVEICECSREDISEIDSMADLIELDHSYVSHLDFLGKP